MFSFVGASAQKNTLDKIIAKVGTQIIKVSDIEGQFYELRAQDSTVSDSNRCDMIESAILENLFYEKANRDSIWVSDDQVEGELENRLRYFIYEYGSEENLMRITGKSIQQFKDQFRDRIKKQMLAQRVQQSLIANVKVNPKEVESFYNQIPEDELPYYSSQVEVAQIIVTPKASQEVENYTYEKLNGIRKEILEEGKSFDIMAGIYSEDPGSRNNGGELGFITKEQVVPAFATNAFRLKEGEISPVFRSKFGYHIVQLMARDGDKAKVRHILMMPNITSLDVQRSIDTLDTVRNKVMNEELTFAKAVGSYSDDDQSKMTGGFIVDAMGNSIIDIDMLDATAVNIIDTLEVGEISAPHIYQSPNSNQKSVRIIYLKNRTTPHQANLDDDFNRIKERALQQKQMEYMQNWVKSNINEYYIEIGDDYDSCDNVIKFKSYIQP